MITRIVLLPVKKEKLKEFELLFGQIKPTILSFEGCISLDLLAETSDSNTITNRFTYSKWRSEAALQNYLQSSFFLDTWPMVKECLQCKAQAWTLQDKTKN